MAEFSEHQDWSGLVVPADLGCGGVSLELVKFQAGGPQSTAA